MGNAGKHRRSFTTIGSQPLHHGVETLREALNFRSSTCLERVRILAITHSGKRFLQTPQRCLHLHQQKQSAADDAGADQ
ncbi:MAG: Uncharacterised protein [Cyanobium sp. ARS6]|nr:MAG: Uncharacterised protein [Cyanobium sp. ARS6]